MTLKTTSLRATSFKTAVAALLALTVIGCKDTIEVPDNQNSTGEGQIAYNVYGDSDFDQFGELAIIDSTGYRVKSVAFNYMWGGPFTGKGAIVHAEPLSKPMHAKIVVTDNSGNNSRTLATIDDPGQRIYLGPIISADGNCVAFVTSDSIDATTSKYRLRVVRTDGNGERIVDEHIAREALPALSPDGSMIAYFNRTEGQGDALIVASTSGAGSTAIVRNLDVGGDLSSTIMWGRNNKIAYGIYNKDEGASVSVVNPDGSGLMHVDVGLWPTWSEDGTKLAWIAPSEDEKSADIVYSVDMGLTITTLTTSPLVETHPQFSPDGKKLLYVLWSDDPMESTGSLHVIDLASGNTREVATPAHPGYWLH